MICIVLVPSLHAVESTTTCSDREVLHIHTSAHVSLLAVTIDYLALHGNCIYNSYHSHYNNNPARVEWNGWNRTDVTSWPVEQVVTVVVVVILLDKLGSALCRRKGRERKRD